MILLKNVSKSYKNGVKALRDINLEIDEGEFVYIIGPTGCGKSTLIKILDGEEIPDSGEVWVANTNVGKLRHSRVPIYRRNIGVVFQDFRLLPTMTVFENIAFALEVLALDKVTIRKRVREVLQLVSLEDKAKAFPRELSGGQQQRATIGRAIANHPKVLIADEPTGNLDPEMSKEIIALLEKINEVENTTILMVTHDSSLVNSYKKRTVALESGYIVSDLTKGGYHNYD
ncbi:MULTISPECIES: cell division ATP-binding protein FtsE [Bacillota]|jgi:cell division transport system ATP-binding protein|uniref:Cell division ATP-binding protein FtsE n=2 Tax=Amedibacillus TaxID=2749846 RepID=A0A7G9GNZ7_9FIRM|nr:MULTISPECIES: cell division ATP-binding protein FtsE [Bacillota]QNM12529.1 cell division ATP-binding protein FtsE [[Eubacterium] hominis]MCH4284162.1 cell division ATP-binding protein FtsE [Amedibacillus hominis]RGB57584.1 cell division ATP-binding protein FtsE [Absiella sp. AM22-9]RGB62310.1 cell division ATP-binding protein FtsE [Absiella sp. AM10-20]RGB67712.1 cell division ATP-binding protein FtsE [Absiella sp. AM09-45]